MEWAWGFLKGVQFPRVVRPLGEEGTHLHRNIRAIACGPPPPNLSNPAVCTSLAALSTVPQPFRSAAAADAGGAAPFQVSSSSSSSSSSREQQQQQTQVGLPQPVSHPHDDHHHHHHSTQEPTPVGRHAAPLHRFCALLCSKHSTSFKVHMCTDTPRSGVLCTEQSTHHIHSTVPFAVQHSPLCCTLWCTTCVDTPQSHLCSAPTLQVISSSGSRRVRANPHHICCVPGCCQVVGSSGQGAVVAVPHRGHARRMQPRLPVNVGNCKCKAREKATYKTVTRQHCDSIHPGGGQPALFAVSGGSCA
jgi:hypothetical protein